MPFILLIKALKLNEGPLVLAAWLHSTLPLIRYNVLRSDSMSYLYQKLSQPSYHVLAFVSTGVLEKLNIKYECISPTSSGY